MSDQVMELLATVNENEQRIEAGCFIASYLVIDDAIVGLAERDIEGLEWESEDAKQAAYDSIEPNHYDSDEVYEAIMGFKPPACAYTFFHEGDLFLGMHEDCDTDSEDSMQQAFSDLQTSAQGIFEVIWLTTDDARLAGM